ncbi:TRAFAC clade GTPase domain-containing protein [Spongiibacter marinus]|uniref:TRAFAC clade GTPase domain-containing protein n=1 Tax=Spongiibacter marinus TaxID=354246 RepID=UPI0019613DEA|nr:hypothetical protein [Spongiibacter marinus]MBM7425046.1 hypothetical protein [Spongiibacter marinus]
MTQTDTKSLLICGLPESGKTTFLAALSYLLTSQEIDVALPHAGFANERAYMNDLASKWCSFEEFQRTNISDEQDIELHLNKEGQKVALYVPDLSGESWDMVWESHRFSMKLESLCRGTESIVIFVNSATVRQPLLIVQSDKMARLLSTDVAAQEEPAHISRSGPDSCKKFHESKLTV